MAALWIGRRRAGNSKKECTLGSVRDADGYRRLNPRIAARRRRTRGGVTVIATYRRRRAIRKCGLLKFYRATRYVAIATGRIGLTAIVIEEYPLCPRIRGKDRLCRIFRIGRRADLIERQKSRDRRRAKDGPAERKHGNEHCLPGTHILPHTFFTIRRSFHLYHYTPPRLMRREKQYNRRDMHILRTRIKKDIVCEFVPPLRTKQSGTRMPNRVIILCGGMPGYPGGKKDLMAFLSQRGYWVFIPRYRGSWESGGSFLKISPDHDVIDVIDQLPKGFPNLWSGKVYKISRPQVYLVGSSFGGAAVILASRDPRVRKVVALSPVTDWQITSKEESIDALSIFARVAFGNGYRGAKKVWDKLKSGTFYNPAHDALSIDGEKILIVHAKDDTIVPAKTSVAFSKQTGARLMLLPRGGHLSLSNTMQSSRWKIIKKFLEK